MLNRVLLIGCLFLLISCGNEKILQLPEIQNAEITKVLDVSPAYIFYDETKEDSVELNRKNLIISTNWLVNVDKRLTLEQALPSIIKLQDKKRNATMHKNKNARNYYTCNDTSIKNLGFIDFTETDYIQESPFDYYAKISKTSLPPKVYVTIIDDFSIELTTNTIDFKIIKTTKNDLINEINLITNSTKLKLEIILNFNKNLSFQDYITIKSELLKLKKDSISFSDTEFIY
ncbi:hypothetical protein [Olleya aquimaris]|uniref:Lipoprotein n=1 Tax=Olleya aquimaris TaxID=639310 RepID=A0A327RBC5_9FLAO|nr:hypothetical protein [Olleya aquimaris]RAJ13272.1 hypothetical protein LY08_02174 [Olleya aquimaris]